MKKNKAIFKIDDHRLSPYTKRNRVGSEQIFYNVDDKSNIILIRPPEIHYYAELLNGEWWWVNGCAECNGNPRAWSTYIECNKHNVCDHCGRSRNELTESVWGTKCGWICDSCYHKEHETKELNAIPENLSEKKCKNCGSWGGVNKEGAGVALCDATEDFHYIECSYKSNTHQIIDDCKDIMMFCKDSSYWRAHLYTRAEHSCGCWSVKE